MVAKSKKGTVLVTGASRGLGLEFVRQYLNDGWNVIATSQKPEKATALKQMVRDGAPLDIFQLDVTDASSVARLAKGLRGRGIDVLINNAGDRGADYGDGKGKQSFGKHDYTVWSYVLAINTLGPLRVMEIVYKNIKSTKGLMVNISSAGGSIAALGGRVGSLAYQASKCALNMIVASTAAQLKKDKIAVVGICPGKTRTQDWHTKKSHPVSAEQSVAALRKTIAKLAIKDTGRFVDRNGKDIPW
jgi:NAD(P)-dependent dehydrogenase (short-subunit alcohol dehydrogenase family)